MTPLSLWSSEDTKMHQILDELLSKKANWNLSTADSVQLYRSLVWFASLKTKIENSKAEIVSVTHAPVAAKERVPGKRATREQRVVAAGGVS